MNTKFSTGDTVLLPVKIWSAITADGKVYYRLSKYPEEGEWIEEEELREDVPISHQKAKVILHVESPELDETREKIEELAKLTEKANSLMDELASKSVEIKFSTVSI